MLLSIESCLKVKQVRPLSRKLEDSSIGPRSLQTPRLYKEKMIKAILFKIK